MKFQNSLRVAVIAGSVAAFASFASAQTVEQRLDALEKRCTLLETQIKYLNDENNKKTTEIIALKGKTKFMSVYGTTTTFTGCNVQIVKDAGSNWAPNGLGNLIIGYNQPRSDGAATVRTGSHNFVLGNENSYSGVMGIVGGFRNFQGQKYGVILSGQKNQVSEANASSGFGVILTGDNNQATGERSLIMNGNENTAAGKWSAILTGAKNRSLGFCSGIITGWNNEVNSSNYGMLGTGASGKVSGEYGAILNGNKGLVVGSFNTITSGSSISFGYYQTAKAYLP